MQKNEFEKQVQQKMEELKLQPSDSVWLNIETHISKKKRRNLAWILFPLLLIGILGGYWLIDSANKSKTHQQNKLSEAYNKKDSSANMQSADQSTKDISALNQPKKILPQSFQKNGQKNSLSKQDKARIIRANLVPKKKFQKNISAIFKSNIVKPGSILTEDENLISKDGEDLKGENKIISDQINEIETDVNNDNDSSIIKVTIDSINKNKEIKPLVTKINQAETIKPEKIKGTWKWGMTFSAGISGVPTKFLGSLDKSFAQADALYSTFPTQGSFGGPLPSKIMSSGALIAGVFAEKNISKKKMITAGLNYKMFSAVNKVGAKNDSLPGYNLNNAVNNYHHYYHFIELPVSLKIQISAKKIPLFWDAGVSLSRLISSNALQLNSNSIVYYQNNSLFNKSQIGFNTGFSASLFSHKKTSVLVGPYIYYGTTKVAEEGLYKNQHFTFIGLRSQILFKK